MKHRFYTRVRLSFLLVTLTAFTGCGGSSSSDETSVVSPVVIPNLIPIQVSNVSIEQGVFDPAPTVDANGLIWMSYSHVSMAPSNIDLVETRLATTMDGGLNWQDVGILVNSASSLMLPPPNETNAIAHEVSRLVYNPYAIAVGADPWLLLWHRYLSVLHGDDTIRLFEHGWIGMKSGATAQTLSSERKLFTGAGYDTVNNNDALGLPEYPLNTMFAPALSDCAAFTEPGVLAKANGVYVSLLCAKGSQPGKIILLRCDHNMSNCNYIGDFISGSEASVIKASYDGFSASELVSSNGQDYLIVTPTISTGNIYRGCVAYKITDIDNAEIERSLGVPVAALIIEEHGDFNGACGYIKELSGSGIMMGEAFFTEQPGFRLFTTDAKL